jgi:hypothetical protein
MIDKCWLRENLTQFHRQAEIHKILCITRRSQERIFFNKWLLTHSLYYITFNLCILLTSSKIVVTVVVVE